MSSLISADNTWVLWGLLVGDAALAIWLEQKYKWASKITGCVLALLGMMILSNVGIIPTESPVYDSVWSYVFHWQFRFCCSSATSKRLVKKAASC